jgi:hypothetical protein
MPGTARQGALHILKRHKCGLLRWRKSVEIARLPLEMATRNTGWGYTGLRDALNNLGYKIG